MVALIYEPTPLFSIHSLYKALPISTYYHSCALLKEQLLFRFQRRPRWQSKEQVSW